LSFHYEEEGMLFLAEIQEVAPKIVVDSYLREKKNLPRRAANNGEDITNWERGQG